jgi:hypothetical protein
MNGNVLLSVDWSAVAGSGFVATVLLLALVELSGGRTTLGYNADRQLERITLPVGLNVERDYPSTHVTARIFTDLAALNEAVGVGYSHNPRALIDSRMTLDQDTVREYIYYRTGRLWGFDDYWVEASTNDCSSSDPNEPIQPIDQDSGMCEPNGTWHPIEGSSDTYT